MLSVSSTPSAWTAVTTGVAGRGVLAGVMNSICSVVVTRISSVILEVEADGDMDVRLQVGCSSLRLDLGQG
jgi:hypothetical protein